MNYTTTQAGMNSPQAVDRLLDTDECAKILGMSPRTLRTWRTDGTGRGPRFVKLGGAIRYRSSDVAEFVLQL